ncbi:hypothetical protein BS78_02G125600 [Paspalum vaginatum]|nr:hypothetical protein BS78_02G125600 [Paspalum vaginatum]
MPMVFSSVARAPRRRSSPLPRGTSLVFSRSAVWRPLVNSYTDIGELSFSRAGRALVSTILHVELFLVATDFLMEGDNLRLLFSAAPLGGFVLPPTWCVDRLSVLAYLAAAGGAASSVLLLACIVWVAVVDGVGFHQRGQIACWAGLPMATSLYSFGYSGHSVFPTLLKGMKEPAKYPLLHFDERCVLVVSFALATLTYSVTGAVGYAMYGDALQPQITLNLPSGNSARIAVITTVLIPLTKYSLAVAPMAQALEGAALRRVAAAAADTTTTDGWKNMDRPHPHKDPCGGEHGQRRSGGSLLGRRARPHRRASRLLRDDAPSDPSVCFLRIRKKTRQPNKPWGKTAACVGIAVVGTFTSVKSIVARLTN